MDDAANQDDRGDLSAMIADAPLWLAAIGIFMLALLVLAAGVLVLCRYDQRQHRDVELDIMLGRRRAVHYRSRQPRDGAQPAGRENVHPLPSTGERDAQASRPVAPAPTADRRAQQRAA